MAILARITRHVLNLSYPRVVYYSVHCFLLFPVFLFAQLFFRLKMAGKITAQGSGAPLSFSIDAWCSSSTWYKGKSTQVSLR